jgi:hypothetical protein
MIQRENFRNHKLTVVLVFLVSLVLSFLPSNASATLAEEIEAAFQAALQDMVGTEFGLNYVTFDFLGVEMTVTVLGFAFCEPTDPYAPPTPTPVPPLTAYGCENLSTVGVDVANDETSADILIEISKIFLDLETSRDETIACILSGDSWPYNGTVIEDGYMLGHASIAVAVDLAFVDGCARATLVPDSSEFTLTPDTVESKDACLDDNMNDILMPILYPLIEDHLDTAFETALGLMMGRINDQLCDATPTENSVWGNVKSIYR